MYNHELLSPKEKIERVKELNEKMGKLLAQSKYVQKEFDDAFEEARVLSAEILAWKNAIHDDYYN